MEFLDDFGITGVPVISVICYFVAELLKQFPVDKRWLPIICAGLGGLLGIGAMFLVPDYPNDNLYSAISVGIVSGLAATGAHQAYSRRRVTTSKEETKNAISKTAK